MHRQPAPAARLLSAVCLLASTLAIPRPAGGEEPHREELLGLLAESLAAPAATDLEATRQDALRAVDAVRKQIAGRALGVILAEELGLDVLTAELARPASDPAVLERCEKRLRRVLAGGIQAPVNRLRTSVGRLARQVRMATTGAEAARESIRVLALAASAEHGDDEAVRRAFHTLAAYSPARDDLARLRRQLSLPNGSTTVSAAFVAAVSRKSFDQPVHFQTDRDGTRITGRGNVTVSLHATAPPSATANRLTLHAGGAGSIEASADRRRVHVRAAASPTIAGSIDVDLRADRIAAASPSVHADFRTQLQGLRIDGLLGRCGLVRRIASDAIGRALSSGDATVARKIESELAKRIDEEAHELAYRINGLLHQALWERLVAVDAVPEMRAWNDATGLHAATYYGQEDQLGALRPPPAVPAGETCDILTRLHESAINNTLVALGGIVLDENTVRGIWEVQLKLTSDQWPHLPPGRIPAEIRLAEHEAVAVQLRDGAIDVVLRVAACAVEGREVARAAKRIAFRYRVERRSGGLVLLRSGFDHGPEATPADTAPWDRALGLFFPPALVPMPRYRPSSISAYVRTTHLDLSAGWLTVGARRVAAEGIDRLAVTTHGESP